jgi:VIT1/CCC1 family predicted Fe2+/Mn2+ transporter
MSKEMGVVVLGVFVIVEPYLGVPNSWHTFFLIISGIAIMVLGFLLRGEALASGSHTKESSGRRSFIENTVFIEQDNSDTI